jgi:hypothetical protein
LERLAWISKGLLNGEEFENFNKTPFKFWELVEIGCEENPKVMFNLYKILKKVRNWDDKTLCRELGISEKAIEEIRSRHKPRFEDLGLKMLYELFPQMAV